MLLGARREATVRWASTGQTTAKQKSPWVKYGKLLGVSVLVGAGVGGGYGYHLYKKMTIPVASPSEGGEYVLTREPPSFNVAREVSITQCKEDDLG